MVPPEDRLCWRLELPTEWPNCKPTAGSPGLARASEQNGLCVHRSAGISTTTCVDLTEATASTPGSSRSSVAASADISDTTRKGPHCKSTCAITESLITRVTKPVKRFRALSATGLPSSGAVAISCACAASSAPSMVVGPLALLARSRPSRASGVRCRLTPGAARRPEQSDNAAQDESSPLMRMAIFSSSTRERGSADHGVASSPSSG